MIKQNFTIRYSLEDNDGYTLKSGVVKVKNRLGSIDAQVSLERFLEKKYGSFNRMVVHECKEDDGFKELRDLLGINNIFSV